MRLHGAAVRSPRRAVPRYTPWVRVGSLPLAVTGDPPPDDPKAYEEVVAGGRCASPPRDGEAPDATLPPPAGPPLCHEAGIKSTHPPAHGPGRSGSHTPSFPPLPLKILPPSITHLSFCLESDAGPTRILVTHHHPRSEGQGLKC